MKRFLKRLAFILLVLAAVGMAVGAYLRTEDRKPVAYRTAAVKRGDLLITIGATGTVEPEELIDVGAQVAGKILSFGKDKDGKTVDYGSVVEEGTVLAVIDDFLYKADVIEATAQLEQAKAGLKHAQAELQQFKAKLSQAQRDWDRAQKLGPGEALAQTTYDSYQATYEAAKANLDMGEAAIDQAKAGIDQAQAALERKQWNLGYCTIKSPVKGVIIDREVNIGQTVVSSLNAPSLFLIAKDLKRMQVWVAVNEADIGSIRPGLPVSFTVDAYPNETFQGQVGKIRLNATMTQNVVTYTVEVVTDNSNGRLLPYLTANAQFHMDRRTGVLLVPNAALRWSPRPEQVAPEYRAALAASSDGTETNDGQRPEAAGGPAAQRAGTLWLRQDNQLRPIAVRAGLTDGAMTEVTGDDLREGTEVVIGEQETSADLGTTNPFVPQIPKGAKK